MSFSKTKKVFLKGIVFIAMTVFGITIVPIAHAQFFKIANESTFAQTYIVSGKHPISGDIISFNKTKQTFNITNITSDKNMFGVVVNDPVVVFRFANGGVPVVRSGEVVVNVTTLGGVIHAGDFITSSPIPGKGQKANDTDIYIVGTALQPFTGIATSTHIVSTSTANVVYTGSIHVLLSVGPHSRNATASTTPLASKPVSAGTATNQKNGVGNGTGNNKDSLPIPVFVKYIIAATIAVGSVIIAFKNFGSNIKNSIISVGRNPLAKSSIQSIVVLDTVLIILVSMAGLFVGFMVFFLPV